VELQNAGYLVNKRSTDFKIGWTSVTGEAEVSDARNVVILLVQNDKKQNDSPHPMINVGSYLFAEIK